MKFGNPEHALKWAFETCSTPIVKISSINAMRAAGTVAGSAGNPGLTVHDRHAQAALILTLCERVLSPLHLAYIRVQFGREAGGIAPLVQYLAAGFGTGLHHRRGIERILRAYCGERVGLREIRRSLACGMLKAVSCRNQVYDRLDVLHAQAMDRLGRAMMEKGLIPGAESEYRRVFE